MWTGYGSRSLREVPDRKLSSAHFASPRFLAIRPMTVTPRLDHMFFCQREVDAPMACLLALDLEKVVATSVAFIIIIIIITIIIIIIIVDGKKTW